MPPALYGGTERVVSFLTEELVAMGHEVTLFASGDSRTAGTLVPVWPNALRLDPAVRDTVAPHMLLMEQVRRRAGEFDVLHFHLDYWPFSVFSRQATPFLTTLHGRLDLPEIRPIFERFASAPVISISDSQRRGLPGANYMRTVHHGLPAGLLAPVPSIVPRYLAFLGRISPERGPHLAIRIARAAGLQLKIAAKVSDADRPWFEAVIRPMIEVNDVEMVGEIPERDKPAFLSGAVGLLMPVERPEPFGLAMIEAMACGTPVLAFGRGAIPEVVDEGVTGYVVADMASAIATVGRLRALPRAAVRERFEQRFTARRMACDYVDVYQSLVAGRAVRPKVRPPQQGHGSPSQMRAATPRADGALAVSQAVGTSGIRTHLES